MFRVPDPDSSELPSTPDARRASRNDPSTTPAGPPPTGGTAASYTPAGPPPPSSTFGSSQLTSNYRNQSSRPSFQPTGRFGSSMLNQQYDHQPMFDSSSRHLGGGYSANQQRGGYYVPASSPPKSYLTGYGQEYLDLEEVDEDGLEEDAEGEDVMEEDDYGYNAGYGRNTTLNAGTGATPGKYSIRSSGNLSLFNSPRSARKSRGNDKFLEKSIASDVAPRPAPADHGFDFLALARGLSPIGGKTKLQESDAIILQTEDILCRLYEGINSKTTTDGSKYLAEAAQELEELWSLAHGSKVYGSEDTIGPKDSAPALARANFITSLLLQIHHPPVAQENNTLTRFGNKLTQGSLNNAGSHTPTPKVLLDWLDTYHVGPSAYDEVLQLGSDFSRDERFWEAILVAAFRGKFSVVLKLLQEGNFGVAETALEDGYENLGYQGPQLKIVEMAIQQAVDVIAQCPAIVINNWDVKGPEWALFRRRISEARADLKEYSESESQSQENPAKPFRAEHFGVSSGSQGFSLTEASRKAESKVPYGIYQQLTYLYGQLLGDPDEVIPNAMDWLDATIGLAVWWDGEEEDIQKGSLAMSRRSLSRSQQTRSVDVTPAVAYRQKLSDSLKFVLNSGDENLSVNIGSLMEIGLACAIESNIEGVITVLQNLSMPVTASIVEIASLAGWLRDSPGKTGGAMAAFSKSDLMVLSYGQQRTSGVSKDEILVRYASLLSQRDTLQNPETKQSTEGWQIAVEIFSRLDNDELTNQHISSLLDTIPLDSPARVDKVLTLCNGLGFNSHASQISERYANTLVDNANSYGEALYYYARAHNSKKIRDVIDLLFSLSLVQSMAYPPLSELDPRLKQLITTPKQALTHLARQDVEAAQLLSTYLSGYATLRKFYDLRDEEVVLKGNQKPAHRPVDRRRQAAAALVATINSAGSSIRGGLYDPNAESVVQVDGLLSLLGEALPFVNQSKRLLTLPQVYTVLGAVEDLQTAPSLIYAQCEECLGSTLAAGYGAETPSPHAMLKKSVSNMTTASSQFSLIGSEMLQSGVPSTEGSGVLVRGEVKRGWDWRKGLRRDAKGDDILRILRLGIAEEIGKAWIEDEA